MALRVNTANLHPSTEACLEAMQALHAIRDFHNILEIGCGNGILSAVAAHIWTGKILAADISPKAVEDTIKTTLAYGLQERIETVRSEGFSHLHIRQQAPYDLIICNLLADIQIRIAIEIKLYLTDNGFAILSGILEWRVAEVEQIFAGMGWRIVSKILHSPWVAYTLTSH